jgi:hypothetical protein
MYKGLFSIISCLINLLEIETKNFSIAWLPMVIALSEKTQGKFSPLRSGYTCSRIYPAEMTTAFIGYWTMFGKKFVCH